MQPGKPPLRKKGRGRLIHVSSFITPDTGQLVVLNEEGKVVKDARKIIYPGGGKGGDPCFPHAEDH
jgi:hypothetical protein